MKYEKPLIMDLGERARRVEGDNGINVCYPGLTANAPYTPGACGTGTLADYTEDCVGGGAPGGDPGGNACTGGQTAVWACYSGETPNYMCNTGGTPLTIDTGCTSGPTYKP